MPNHAAAGVFQGQPCESPDWPCSRKKLYDKREDIAKKDQRREAEREMKIRPFADRRIGCSLYKTKINKIFSSLVKTLMQSFCYNTIAETRLRYMRKKEEHVIQNEKYKVP